MFNLFYCLVRSQRFVWVLKSKKLLQRAEKVLSLIKNVKDIVGFAISVDLQLLTLQINNNKSEIITLPQSVLLSEVSQKPD